MADGEYPNTGCADLMHGRWEVNVQEYCKATHTDQYLIFSSHYALNHKLGVIQTLYDQCDNIVTEEVDAAKEITHVDHALCACGCPSWSFKIVREQLDQQELQKKLEVTKKDSAEKSTKVRVTQPCFGGVSEALSWVFCCHGVATSMKPHMTLMRMLVHPKDTCTLQVKCRCCVPGPM